MSPRYLSLLERWLGFTAARVVKREHPCIVAITGSVGKSSTKNAIAIMLGASVADARIRVSEKNYNNELGVPLSILGLRAPGRSFARWVELLFASVLFLFGWKKTGIVIFVLEMGADKPGDLAYLVAIAPPTIAVITAVTPEDRMMAPVHAANYPSIEAVAEEKATLVKATAPEGTVILNRDDTRVWEMRHQSRARVISFGQSEEADVRLTFTRVRTAETGEIRVPTGLEMGVESLNRLRKMYLPGVFGKSISYAMCVGMAVNMMLDAGLDEAVERVAEKFQGLPGRTRIVSGIKNTILLDDSYNASPVAVLAALRDLAAMELASGQRRIVCLGEMRELGVSSEALHERVGEEVGSLHLDLLVACGTLAHAMAKGAERAGMPSERIKLFDDTPEAGRFLQEMIRPGDVILAKASEGNIQSKGVRMERIIKELMADPIHAPELLVRQEPAWQRK